MKIYGKLKCKITMKGVTTEGDAYVTPHSSLLVKANCNPRREEELKKTFPDVFEEGVGRCTKKKSRLQLTHNMRQLFRSSRLVPHAVLEGNPTNIKEQYDRRNGPIWKEFKKGEDVYVKVWEVPTLRMEARSCRKTTRESRRGRKADAEHANQLRHNNTRTSWSREDKSLKTPLDVLEMYNNQLRNKREAACESDVNTALPCSPEPSLRRSTRIRRPVKRYGIDV
ncbi:hypothetical protein COOONC_26574 [Cooperia oncophora]